MGNPIEKLAACPIYFGLNGGKFSELGNANATEDDRLLCGRAFDCGHCAALHEWVNVQLSKGYVATWECVTCISRTKKLDDQAEIERVITGYYQAGRRQTDPSDQNFDPDMPGLEGCTHVFEVDDDKRGRRAGETCGWESSFLQLVLRRRKNV